MSIFFGTCPTSKRPGQFEREIGKGTEGIELFSRGLTTLIALSGLSIECAGSRNCMCFHGVVWCEAIRRLGFLLRQIMIVSCVPGEIGLGMEGLCAYPCQ